MNELAGYSLGGYQLEEEIGRGSMGVVYRGKQIALGREVAIKILPHSLATDASYVARFIREAQIMARLNHPNIVQIYDAGQQNRTLYFVMEFVQGPTLANLILMDGMIPQHLAAEYGAQIADALDAAYRERYVIHRDIKPENLMLNRWGKIKVMDFGLARATGHKTITIAQSLVGSIYYSSPEQLRGQTLDNRSDIFALGIVLYEMVSGRRPFNGRTMTELSQAIMSGKVQSPGIHNPELSPHLESIILKALKHDREQRYEEAATMAHELRVLNLQPPELPATSISPSSSLPGILPTGQSTPSNIAPSRPIVERDRSILPRRPQLQSLPYLDIALDQAAQTEVQSNEPRSREEIYPPAVDASRTSDTPIPFTNQELTEGTKGEKQAQQVQQPQQLSLPEQATFSQLSEEIPVEDRHTVKEQIHRLFRLPSRKTSQPSTHTGNGSTTGI